MAIYGGVTDKILIFFFKKIAQNFILKRAKNYEELKDSKHIEKKKNSI
jgi:hypothetical protein